MITGILAVAWLAGLSWAAWSGPGGAVAGAALATLPAAWAYRARPPLALCLGAACAGVALLATVRWETATTPPPPSSIAHLIDDGLVRVHGVLRADPEERERSQRLRIAVREVDTSEGRRPATGGLLVRVPLGRTLRAGDAVEIEGRLSAPPELAHFDYRAYLARQGIDAVMEYPRVRVTGHEQPGRVERGLRAARRAGSRSLDRSLPQPEGALARGILLGDRSAIPAGVSEDFNRSGTAHLIAISGYNITLVAGMVMAGLAWLVGRRRAALVALAAITGYGVFVGLSPSVARALVMGALVIGASVLGRPGAPLVSLALAAVAMTLHDPRVLGDVGFQLSFAATAGIVLLVPPLQGAGRRLAGSSSLPGWLSGALAVLWDTTAVTLAASVATIPILVHAFGRISLVAPLANLVLAPVFPLVLLTSAAAAAVGAMLPPLSGIAGALAWPPLAFTVAVAGAAADVPGAALEVGHSSGVRTLVMYAAGAALFLVGWRVVGGRPAGGDSGRAPHGASAAAAVGLPLLLLAGFIAAVWIKQPRADGRLTVAYTEAGGAPVALITGPRGERVLVDTGPSPAALTRAVDPLLPPGRRRLAAVVITRAAPTAVGGLTTAVERYGTQAVVVPAASAGASIPAGDAGVLPVEPGGRLLLSGGAASEFEAAADGGDRLAVVAVLGHRRVAVTPGAEADVTPVRVSATPGQLAVTAAALPGPSYELRRQGPIRASTDGARIRLRPARGPLLPGAAASR